MPKIPAIAPRTPTAIAMISVLTRPPLAFPDAFAEVVLEEVGGERGGVVGGVGAGVVADAKVAEEVIVDELVVDGIVGGNDGAEEVVLDDVAEAEGTAAARAVVAYIVVCSSEHSYKIVAPSSKMNSPQ